MIICRESFIAMDRIGMAASMEMRVPFLENDLIDFAFHLPRRAKLHRNTGKWLVKQAAAEVLPADVVFARKEGFPLPTAYAFGTERLLDGGMLAELMQWPAATIGEIMGLLRGDGALRFQVVGLELWFRLYFGGETPEALGERLTVWLRTQRGRLRPCRPANCGRSDSDEALRRRPRDG